MSKSQEENEPRKHETEAMAIDDVDMRCMGTLTINRLEQKIEHLYECLEAEKELNQKTQLKLNAYIKGINRIDDYFEYSMASKKDQEKVHRILSGLTDSLISGGPGMVGKLWFEDKTEDEILEWPDKFKAIFNLREDCGCLQEDNAQLKAQAERLRSAANLVLLSGDQGSGVMYSEAIYELAHALDATPEQCLAQVKSDLLCEIGKEWHCEAESVRSKSVFGDELIDIAKSIRQQAI